MSVFISPASREGLNEGVAPPGQTQLGGRGEALEGIKLRLLSLDTREGLNEGVAPPGQTQLGGRGEALEGIKLRLLSGYKDSSGPRSCGASAMPNAGAGTVTRL